MIHYLLYFTYGEISSCLQQSQRGKAHDEQPGSAKQTQHVEHSQGHERYFHKQSGPAKPSGKNPASEKVFQKQLIHERRSREQTAPVDYSVEHSGTGRQPAGTDSMYPIISESHKCTVVFLCLMFLWLLIFFAEMEKRCYGKMYLLKCILLHDTFPLY